jgi:hypothetical protein
MPFGFPPETAFTFTGIPSQSARRSRQDSESTKRPSKQAKTDGSQWQTIERGEVAGELAAISSAEKRCVVPDYAEARR